MPYFYAEPTIKEVPMIFSSPHSGTEVPDNIAASLNPYHAKEIPDTDFDVDKLYSFAPSIGAHFLSARYNRYVVDLNRSLDSKPLYSDSRKATGLVPVHDFRGVAIYPDDFQLTADEINKRIDLYYTPYHKKLAGLIESLRARHDKILVLECHSIVSLAPTIQATPFSDLMLGNNDGITTPETIMTLASNCFKSAGLSVSCNSPFKGGFITRHYANPHEGVYTFQIEMNKDLYLEQDSNSIDLKKSASISKLLRQLSFDLIAHLEK